ncbi:DUF4809 family protein [Enterococcus italicus]|uniref:DUF4809 family protein n=1 Tax=Enterococcus italicus TaxID=246144 RepID=UPI0020746C03|nr:DUF4809 family protein [Enterococcus italicus]MCM6881390.1 DUF4809 family protein [Enterococcus italicus]
MNEVVIESSYDFVDGGCNACATVKCTTYALKYKDFERSLDQLDTLSLVKEVAMVEGFCQKLVMDFDDEYIQFSKGTTTVALQEEFGGYQIKGNQGTLFIKDQQQKAEQVFLAASRILDDFFGIHEICFRLETMD